MSHGLMNIRSSPLLLLLLLHFYSILSILISIAQNYELRYYSVLLCVLRYLLRLLFVYYKYTHTNWVVLRKIVIKLALHAAQTTPPMPRIYLRMLQIVNTMWARERELDCFVAVCVPAKVHFVPKTNVESENINFNSFARQWLCWFCTLFTYRWMYLALGVLVLFVNFNEHFLRQFFQWFSIHVDNHHSA